jgi:hypothetical protein
MMRVLVLLTAVTAQAAAGATHNVLRTEHGKQDLQVVWNYRSDVPLERPKELAETHDRFWLDCVGLIAFARHENNDSTSMIPTGGRKAEQEAARAKP